jgi:hypothetical protein
VLTLLRLDAASGSFAEAALCCGNGLGMVMTGFHEKPLLLTRDVSPGHIGSSPRSSRRRYCPHAPRPADGFKIHVADRPSVLSRDIPGGGHHLVAFEARELPL